MLPIGQLFEETHYTEKKDRDKVRQQHMQIFNKTYYVCLTAYVVNFIRSHHT
jgi:hypothetical protein